MSENILDIARRVRERRQEMSAEPVALADAVERMAAAMRKHPYPAIANTLRELGIPLTEAGDEQA